MELVAGDFRIPVVEDLFHQHFPPKMLWVKNWFTDFLLLNRSDTLDLRQFAKRNPTGAAELMVASMVLFGGQHLQPGEIDDFKITAWIFFPP